MTWKPNLEGSTGPAYVRIANAMIADIRSGALKPGDRLPGHRELAIELGLTVSTVSRAFSVVIRENLIDASTRRGTHVSAGAGAMPLQATAFSAGAFQDASLIDLRGHRAPLGTWDMEVSQAMMHCAERKGFRGSLEYAYGGGHRTYREAAADWFGATSNCVPDPDRVFICNGAQHALYCALLALCAPGDYVATERLTYASFKAAVPLLGVQLVPVEIDEDGIVPESFEEVCATQPIKVLVCVPNLHNPTTATISEARRYAIVEIARRYDVQIVEDDVYGGLTDTQRSTLVSLAPERVLRLTGLSKTLGPGLRVGFLDVPAAMTAKIAAVLHGTSWMGSAISMEVATEMIRSGAAERILRENRAELARRNADLQHILGHLNIQDAPYSPHRWLQLPDPWTKEEFVKWGQQNGVLVLGSEAFAVGRENGDHAIRLSVAAPPRRELLSTAAVKIAEALAAHSPFVEVMA
jgi:DNA-binding transcriptional MocR family regulator